MYRVLRGGALAAFFALGALGSARADAPPAWLRGSCPLDDATASRIVARNVHGQALASECMFVAGEHGPTWMVSTVTTADLNDPQSAARMGQALGAKLGATSGPPPRSAAALFDALHTNSTIRYEPASGIGDRSLLGTFVDQNVTMKYLVVLQGDRIVCVATASPFFGPAKDLARAVFDKHR